MKIANGDRNSCWTLFSEIPRNKKGFKRPVNWVIVKNRTGYLAVIRAVLKVHNHSSIKNQRTGSVI